MPLTQSDPHYWSPVPEIVEHLAEKYKGHGVLEIGPGSVPFPAATTFVDWQNIAGIPEDGLFIVDVGKESLPFPDKSFEFVYARHVLEDMANPFHLISEMSRVGKAGYIETPSPICELTRGVDGGRSPPWRGYNHHRWIIWAGNGALRFLAKFPMVEYLGFPDETVNEQRLRSSARYWNTSYLWQGNIEVVHRQCPHDFAMPEDYGAMLSQAMIQSKTATDSFYRTILNVP